MALLMVSIPNMSTANPMSMDAISLCLSLLQDMIITTPTAASTGVNDVGLKIFIQKLSPLMPPRLSSHAVTVVPMSAPRIILMVCPRRMSPELTKPTSITVVADDD